MKGYEYVCTRLGECLDSVKKWAKGEKLLGLTKSLFICENGTMEQYVEVEEGEEFNEYVKKLTPEQFDTIVRDFYLAIENKDLVRMHCGLAIFDEMDTFNFGTEDMKRRLMRIRQNTEAESYKFKINTGVKDFIIFKGKVYTPLNKECHRSTKTTPANELLEVSDPEEMEEMDFLRWIYCFIGDDDIDYMWAIDRRIEKLRKKCQNESKSELNSPQKAQECVDIRKNGVSDDLHPSEDTRKGCGKRKPETARFKCGHFGHLCPECRDQSQGKPRRKTTHRRIKR